MKKKQTIISNLLHSNYSIKSFKIPQEAFFLTHNIDMIWICSYKEKTVTFVKYLEQVFKIHPTNTHQE